jgi:hypothetical protein
MSQQERLIPSEAIAPWDLVVPTTLRTPQNLSETLRTIEIKKSIFKEIALLRQAIPTASTNQIRLATDQFNRTIAPLIEWAQKPRVRSELFMYKRSITGDKFFQLVSYSLEKLINFFFWAQVLTTPKWGYERQHKRAQIMHIRGLALSCAPNFTRFGDINLSRSYSGIA